ncbi:MAG: hypothetical protein ACLFQM_04915 [Fidelibacterota bacterium]
MITQITEINEIRNAEVKFFPQHSGPPKKAKHPMVEKDVFASHTEVNVGKYNAEGKVEKPVSSGFHVVLAIQQQIDDQVKKLTHYYKEIFEKSEVAQKSKEALSEYFTSNPEDLKEIEKGNIPEYWNQENTAKRIFDIAVQGYKKDMNIEDFGKKAEDFVTKAYEEVENLIGNMPDLVKETREAVMNGLDQFRDGTPISEISFS